MDESEKIYNICEELVKIGVVAVFRKNNEFKNFNITLFETEKAELIISNFNKIGCIAEKTEEPELIKVFYGESAEINGIFEKYC